jgi:hypothetical protein
MTNKRDVLPKASYRAAIARAVEWLGDRYLLAKPIHTALRKVGLGQNRRIGRHQAAVHRD